MDFALLVPIVGQFVLRPVQTVIVTSKEELDAALATADQITVEGDDELLSYAVNKAADDPENRITVEGTAGEAVQAGQPPAYIVYPPTRAHLDEAFEAKRREAAGSRRRVLYATGTVLVLVIGVAIGWVWFGTKAPTSSLPVEHGWVPNPPVAEVQPPPAESPAPAPSQPPQPLTPRSDFWANLPSLVWPLVAIAAIVALFLIARQAISSGRNVEITWKVTEKVSGRVVITKVRDRAMKGRAAA
jgi:hypothetical protein